ncbi:MAG: hypothetical protein ACI8W8_004541, partial [Rhodothermales bacterium]
MSCCRALVLYAFLACAAFAQEAPTPASSFSEVARHLNADSDFYLFLNSEQVHDELLELSNFVESILVGSQTQTAPERASAQHIFAAVRHFLGETGLPGMRAVGMSSRRRADGRFANRSVI